MSNIKPYSESVAEPISRMLDSYFSSLCLEELFGASDFSDREIYFLSIGYICEAITEILAVPDNVDLESLDEESRIEIEKKIAMKKLVNDDFNFVAFLIFRSWRYAISQSRKSLNRQSRGETIKISMGPQTRGPQVSLTDRLKAAIGRGDFKKVTNYEERERR